MLMKSGGGSARDIIFRAIVQADPSNKKTFADLGKMAVDTQKQITSMTTAEVKKRADEAAKKFKENSAATVREAKSASLDVSKIHQQAEMADFKFRQRLGKQAIIEEKKNEEELARWRQRLRANSAQLEQRENIRIARESQREQTRLALQSQRDLARADAGRMRRTDAGIRAIGGIGNIARGVAYSGLIGEDNTQRVLNTVAGVEGVASIGRGATDLYKGARAYGLAGSAASGASAAAGAGIAGTVATVGAGLAALTGVIAAATSGVLTFKEAMTHGIGKGATYGSLVDKVATGEASVLANTVGYLPQTLLNANGLGAFGNLNRSNSALAKQQNAYEQYDKNGNLIGGSKFVQQQAIKQQAAFTGSLGEFQRQASNGNLAASRSVLTGDINRFREMSGGGHFNNEAVAVAYENARKSMEQVKRLAIESARAQIDGSRDYVENLKNAAQLSKQVADEAKRNYEGDAMKLGSASHEEIALYREIDRKKKAGEDLNQREIEAATGLSGYEDFARSQAVKRAEAAGLGDLLAPSREKARQTEQKAAATQIESWAAEVDVGIQHEVIVKLEGENFADQLRDQFGEKVAEVFANYEQKLIKTMEDKIRQGQVQQRNATRVAP